MSVEGYKAAMGDVARLLSQQITPRGNPRDRTEAEGIDVIVYSNLAIAHMLEAIHQRLLNLALKGDK